MLPLQVGDCFGLGGLNLCGSHPFGNPTCPATNLFVCLFVCLLHISYTHMKFMAIIVLYAQTSVPMIPHVQHERTPWKICFWKTSRSTTKDWQPMLCSTKHRDNKLLFLDVVWTWMWRYLHGKANKKFGSAPIQVLNTFFQVFSTRCRSC